MRSKSLSAILTVGAVAGTLVWASARQRSDQKPKATENGQASSRPWTFKVEELVYSDASGEGEARTVIATSDQDTVIRADRFVWNEKTKTARATGNLHMSDDRTEGTADQVDIDYKRDKRLMVLTGNVKLTLKPRKEARPEAPSETAGSNGGQPAREGGSGQALESAGDTDQQDATAGLRDYPIEVTCDRVEYEYARDKRHAILIGNFRAVQKLKDYTRTLVAERAEWFGREERVLLKGPVKLEDTKGRKGETPEDVEVFTAEGKESIKLRKGTYSMPVEEESEPPTRPPDRQGPGGRPGPSASPG